MTQYHIPNHVHFVADGDAVIFMDLRSDQYSMMVGADARACNSVLRNFGDMTCRTIILDDSEIASGSSWSVVSELLECGLLTTERQERTRPAPLQMPLPDRDLVAPDSQCRATISSRDVCRFIHSSIIAKWRLTYAGIHETVQAVERRNMLRGSCDGFDLDKARALVCIYNKLKRLAPIESKCLYDSLRLLEFLAKYNCFPSWVFAVQTDPWYAHCWVQHGDVAFNQDADSASAYVPIMSV